jgi:hypothetical protein
MAKGINTERLEPLIFRIRGHRVVLDADLARLYGSSTKALNQAVKRNPERFPFDFAFQLTAEEFGVLRSQFATSSSQAADPEPKTENRSQIVTGSQSHRSRDFRPWVFTEHGALMAANVLRSEQAVRMSVFLVRAFVRLREQVAANTAILKRLAEIDKALVEHDAALSDLYRKLRPLLEPPDDPPARPIGFHTDID